MNNIELVHQFKGADDVVYIKTDEISELNANRNHDLLSNVFKDFGIAFTATNHLLGN